MYAVVKTGGKQYKVAPGEKLKVEQIPADVGAQIVLDQVLLVGDGSNVRLGQPIVAVRPSMRRCLATAAATRSRSSRCAAASTIRSIRAIVRASPSSKST